MVWSGLGAAPVPSTSSTWVSATTAVSTATYWWTSAASESGRCAGSATGAIATRASGTKAGGGRMRDSSLFHREGHHHPGRQMFSNVAVQHPATGVGSVEQNIHRGTGRHQHGVLPHEVVVRHAVDCQYEEPLAVRSEEHTSELQSLAYL